MLPTVNTLVRVAVGSSEDPADGLRACDVPSRVEDVEALVPGQRRRVLVATPRFAGDWQEPEPGTACTLTWTAADGIVELPVAYETTTIWTSDPSVLRLWWLAVTGDAVRIQRREYFRCPIQLPVTVTSGSAGLSGRTTDLGEGGLRCLLVGDPLTAGDGVRAEVTLADGSTLSVPGSVLRSDPAARAPDHADTVVRFDDPEMQGDDVRRVIFAEQMRLRRLGLD